MIRGLSEVPSAMCFARSSISQAARKIEAARRSRHLVVQEALETVAQTEALATDTMQKRISREKASIEALVTRCDDLAAFIARLHESARSKSRGYERACVDLSVKGSAPPLPADISLDTCLGRLQSLSDEAKSLHDRIVGMRGVNALAASLSGEASALYRQLIDIAGKVAPLVSQARRCASDACAAAEKRATLAKEHALAGARDEVAEIEILADDCEKRQIDDALSVLASSLKASLSPEDSSFLWELESLLLREEDGGPVGTSEFIPLGLYSVKVYEGIDRAIWNAIEPLVSEALANCYSDGAIVAPAIVDRRVTASVLLCGEGRWASEQMVNTLVAEFEVSGAPLQEFVLLEPSGNRDTFKDVLKAAKDIPEVFGEGVVNGWTAIEGALSNLSDLVDERNLDTLVDHADIYEYNATAKGRKLPLVTACLMISGAIPEEAIRHIDSIVRNGPTAGVGLIVGVDLVQTPDEVADELLRNCAGASILLADGKNDGSCTMGEVRVVVEGDGPKRLAKTCLRARTQIDEAAVAAVPLSAALSNSEWHTAESTRGLSMPFGLTDDGSVAKLEFGDMVSGGISHFALVAGSTGSGKSSLLHAVIMSSLLRYGPDELQVYLLDFKSGVEFDVYSRYRIPQLRVLALDALQAFGHSILVELHDVMMGRYEEFKTAGVRGISGYRASTGKKMPRILVVMDEFQALFNEEHDKATARECATLMADFVSLARVCGIHFILSTQTLSRISTGSFSIAQSTLDEMHVRIGLMCSESECERLFGPIFGRTASKSMGHTKGSGVMTENDLKVEPAPFRASYATEQERAEYLRLIEQRYAPCVSSWETLVFRSSSVPLLSDCPELASADKSADGTVPIYLGQPVMIGPSVKLVVSRRRRSSLLVVGAGHQMIDNIVGSYLTSACRSSSSAMVSLVDGSVLVGERQGEATARACTKNSGSIWVATTDFDVLDTIDKAYEELQGRISARRNLRGVQAGVMHIIFNEMQWIDPLIAVLDNRDKDLEGYSDFDVADDDCGAFLDSIIDDVSGLAGAEVSRLVKLERLLDSGYSYGINVVVTSSDFMSVKERLYDFFSKFQNRIVFGLDGEDADRLIHGTQGQIENIRDNMAIFADGIHRPVVFKPFDARV